MSVQRRKDNKGRVLKEGESQRKDGSYMYRYNDMSGNRKCVYSNDLTTLREKEAVVQKLAENNIDYALGKITVIDLVKKYMRVKKDITPQTSRSYDTAIRQLSREPFAERKIRDIKSSDAQLFVVSMYENGRSKSTIQQIIIILKFSFQMACDEEILIKNPFQFRLSRYVPETRKTRKPLTSSQQENLLAFMENSHVYSRYFDIVNVLLWTGMRVSEFCGLTINDIDFEHQRIRVDHQLIFYGYECAHISKTKTAKGIRYIPITDKIISSLTRLIDKSKINPVVNNIDGYTDFIAIKPNGRFHSCYSIESVFRKLSKAYNTANPDDPIEYLSPHVLRHTFCTNMAKAGMDVKNLQYIMGHASVNVTLNVYTHSDFKYACAQMQEIVNDRMGTSIV